MGVFAAVPLIVDTSALTNWRIKATPTERALFRQALEAGELRTHPVVRLEFLHDAYDRSVVRIRERMFSIYDEIEMDTADGAVAVKAVLDLAYREPEQTGWHKVMAGDALIAAAAVRVGVGVLHHDHHYERLVDVMPSLVQVPFPAF